MGARRGGRLSPKDIRVVEAFLRCGIQTKAMIEAGHTQKYAKSKASAFFKRPEIADYLNQRQVELRVKDEGITDDELTRLAVTIARANFGEIVEKLVEHDWDLSCLSENEKYALSSFKRKVTRTKTKNGDDVESEDHQIGTRDNLRAIQLIMQSRGMLATADAAKGSADGHVDRVREARARMQKE